MEYGALKSHLSNVIMAAQKATPATPVLVFRSGIFLVVSNLNMDPNDIVIRKLHSEDLLFGFTAQTWNSVTGKASRALKAFQNAKNTKNAYK